MSIKLSKNDRSMLTSLVVIDVTVDDTKRAKEKIESRCLLLVAALFELKSHTRQSAAKEKCR